MSRDGKAFQLGAVVVPIGAAMSLTQRIETFGGRNRLRFSNGAGLNQVAWQKQRITLSGTGWCPLGLGALNYAAPLTLKCGKPVSLTAASNILTLPTTRRTDAGYLPYAWAHLPDGPVNTPVVLAGHVATCTPVAGAVAYSVMYYPEISALCDPPAETVEAGGAVVSWELTAEEV
ncbi:MAG: hypothetical protein Q7J47_03360 [Azoarcus sp.]|nr:hypothetical protein [Azoarcus sp.]